MSDPSGMQLLAALDDASSEVEQVMAVLGMVVSEPASLPLGVGDRKLLDLARTMTHQPLELTASCGACGTSNAMVLDTRQLAPYEPRSRWLGPRQGVREPTYGDLCGLPEDDVDAAAAELGARCSVGTVSAAEALAALDDVDGSLAGPIELACVECSATLLVDADVEQFAVHQLRRLAYDVDRQVHVLASAYGWDLATIAALSDRRRARLVELVETR